MIWRGITMKKYILVATLMLGILCMTINIDWNKESIKAFITGGITVWMAIKFYGHS